MKDLDLIVGTIQTLKQSRDNATELLAKLSDEAARLRSGLPIGPAEAIEALRKHAITCIERGDDVTFFDREDILVQASLCREHASYGGYGDGKLRCWKEFRSGTHGGYDSHTSSEFIVDAIKLATMFKANVEKP